MTLLQLDEYGKDHSFYVINGEVNNSFLSVLSAADNCTNQLAKHNLMYGAGRRLRIIQKNYVVVNEITNPERKVPLSDDEQVDLNLHLNSFYMHLNGLMDNLAWAIVLEMNFFDKFDENSPKHRRKVGLFTKAFLSETKSKFSELSAILESKKDWRKTLKELRDPVAHRIPIYAVPSFLNPEQVEEYKKKWNTYNDKLLNSDFEEASEILEEITNLGTYAPFFHNVENGQSKIYPVNSQVEYDLDNFFDIASVVVKIIKDKA